MGFCPKSLQLPWFCHQVFFATAVNGTITVSNVSMEMWLPPRNEDVAKDSQISGPSVCLKTKGMRRINSGVSTNLLQHQLVSSNMPTWTVTWWFFGTAGHVFFPNPSRHIFFQSNIRKSGLTGLTHVLFDDFDDSTHPQKSTGAPRRSQPRFDLESLRLNLAAVGL